MKIIFSRKGFDSENGGIPSPILPDGRLLLFPIPQETEGAGYRDMLYEGKSYYEIIQELNPRAAKKLEGRSCHVDPDLSCRYGKKMRNWMPAFGQQGSSQIHLKNHGIGAGDIFLFYGWFRQTEYDASGKLRFVDAKRDKTPDRHVIYGYLEIGEVITEQEKICEKVPYHPHARRNYAVNGLYLPKEKFSLIPSRKGCGTLDYAPVRQLTMEGHKRSEWALPDCFKESEISYHENDSYGWREGCSYFRAAYRGQEFVVKKEMTEEMKAWLFDVITQE